MDNPLAMNFGFVRPTITVTQKAIPGPGIPLQDLVERFIALGNPILEINEEENYILVQQRQLEQPYGCLLCLERGQHSLLDTEDEFRDHLNIEHAGWEEAYGG